MLALSLLAGAPALAAADQAQLCIERMQSGAGGPSLDDRIQHLQAEPGVCPRSLEEEDCRGSFDTMIQRLQNTKAKITQACRDAAEAERQAREACNGAQSCLQGVRGVLERAKESLGSIKEELGNTAYETKLIREVTLGLIKNHYHQMDKNPLGKADYKPFLPMAQDVLKAAADPETDPGRLRQLIQQKLHNRGHDPAVNSLWLVANALELEQYSRRQRDKIDSTVTGLGRNGTVAGAREGKIKSVPTRTNARSSDITKSDTKQAAAPPNSAVNAPTTLSSPSSGNALGALPGLVGSAAQLAGGASSEVTRPGDLLAPNDNRVDVAKLPSVAELVAGENAGAGKAETPEAGKGEDLRTSSLGRDTSDFALGTGARGQPRFRGKESPARGRSGPSGASAKANLARVEGQPLGSAGGETQESAGRRASSAAGGQGGLGSGQDDFGNGGMGGGGELGAEPAPASPNEAPLVRAGTGETPGLLENPPELGSEAAAELVSAGGPSLFRRVRIAHSRSLKRGLVTGPRPKL